MNKANTQVSDGNTLIAIFMGLYHSKSKYPFRQPKKIVRYAEPQYHTSWNWLMPVVEEISEVCKPDSKEHYYWNDHEDVRIFRMTKQETWQACVDFIQYYNSINNQQNI